MIKKCVWKYKLEWLLPWGDETSTFLVETTCLGQTHRDNIILNVGEICPFCGNKITDIENIS